MRPYDALTEIDKETIKAYLSVYGNTQCGPLPKVLRYWNKNKNTLYKALGNNLRISKMIEVPTDRVRRITELEALYHPYTIWYDTDVSYIKNHFEDFKTQVHNTFISDVLKFWVNQNYCIQDLSILSRLFLHKNLEKGYITCLECDQPYHFRDFKCTLKNGTKTLRTIQRILKATKYPRMDLFSKWSNNVNNSLCNEGFKSKLTISIHPVDFMSMSDNNCNWRSCMSWINRGCYRSGTLEMMNSNCVVIAYLEAIAPMNISFNEKEYFEIPNKSWRCLFYVHKNILLCGKSYPYHNEKLNICVLDWLRELVKENLNWDYQFINQEYKDLINLENNFYVRDLWDPNWNINKKHHKIIVYTNAMYNDIIESKYPRYLCCRNKVKKTIKLNVSGPVTCICCGDIISTREDIVEYDSVGSTLVCDKCIYDCHCTTCKTFNYYIKYKNVRAPQGNRNLGNYCDDDCIKEMYYFKGFDRIIPISDLLQKSRKTYYFLEYDSSKKEQNELAEMAAEYFRKAEDIKDFLKIFSNKFTIYSFNESLAGFGFMDIHYNERMIQQRIGKKLCPYNEYNDLYCLDINDSMCAEMLNKAKNIKNKKSLIEVVKGV